VEGLAGRVAAGSAVTTGRCEVEGTPMTETLKGRSSAVPGARRLGRAPEQNAATAVPGRRTARGDSRRRRHRRSPLPGLPSIRPPAIAASLGGHPCLIPGKTMTFR